MMDTLMIGKSMADWLIQVGVSAGVALGLFKWIGQKWVEQRLSVSLEKFKAQQQKELERVKADQQKEIERLRHLLASRVSKIHEKEFEFLPQAWLMLNDLHGSAALALDMTFKSYPDFRKLPEDQFEEFLTASPASRLTQYQKDELRKATDRQRYFSDAMAGIYLDDANEKHRVFQNYLIEHRIFMNDELRDKFGAVQLSLVKALTSYGSGKRSDTELVHSAYEEMNGIKAMVDDVEKAVQTRLRYEEA
jgi:hypothetical protein